MQRNFQTKWLSVVLRVLVQAIVLVLYIFIILHLLEQNKDLI